MAAAPGQLRSTTRDGVASVLLDLSAMRAEVVALPPRSRVPPRGVADVGQLETIAWLSTSQAYGGDGAHVTRIDTHASVIFLAGDRAYKLKRQVRYDYLDYSTAERRRICAVREVRLNRRTAPTLYRGVRAVTREADGSLALDGAGPAIDWLVEMVRFADDAQLDRLAARRALALDLMPALADAVVKLHDLAEWRFDRGGCEGMVEIITGNRAGLDRYGSHVLDPAACRRLTDDSLSMVELHEVLLEARRRLGFVRWGHGDLHLGNVCLLAGVPTLFDCVEFNAAIACGDVLYDLAFLLMDLIHRRLPRHANAVFNRYVEVTGDTGGLALCPLYLATRAAVRAKTAATSARVQPTVAAAEHARGEARRYLRLAERLLTPRVASLVCVGGLSGSGKSTLARRLAAEVGPAPGAVILRSDYVRKRLLGVSPTTRLDASGYTESINRRVYRAIAEQASEVLRAGHAVVVDAVFANPLDRATLHDLAWINGARFAGLWLDTPLVTRVERLTRRTHDVSDATTAVAMRQDTTDLPKTWRRLDASGDRAQVQRVALTALGPIASGGAGCD